MKRILTKKILWFLAVFALSAPLTVAKAQPSLDNISEDDLEDISKEFSANFTHKSVSGAAPLGRLFGLEVGLITGSTQAAGVSKISEREGGEGVDQLLNAGVYGAVSIPFGITAEMMLLPEQEISDMSISNQSLALKWTFFDLFVDIAAKAHMSNTKIDYSDTIDGVNTTVELENTTTGFMLLASKSFFLIEPFIGVGTVSRNTNLSASGTATIFDATYTSGQDESVSGTSSQFLAGAQVNLGVLKISGQYENVFDTSVTSLKLSFAF